MVLVTAVTTSVVLCLVAMAAAVRAPGGIEEVGGEKKACVTLACPGWLRWW
jgi:hypothetical protein